MPATQNTIDTRMHFLKMNGREIFKSAVRVMERAVRELLEKHGVSKDEVDHVIPHQANFRIVESLAQRLEISMDKFFCNLENYGNTSAASVPLALDEGRAQGRFHSGQLGVLVAFGAGLTWSATLIRF